MVRRWQGESVTPRTGTGAATWRACRAGRMLTSRRMPSASLHPPFAFRSADAGRSFHDILDLVPRVAEQAGPYVVAHRHQEPVGAGPLPREVRDFLDELRLRHDAVGDSPGRRLHEQPVWALDAPRVELSRQLEQVVKYL